MHRSKRSRTRILIAIAAICSAACASSSGGDGEETDGDVFTTDAFFLGDESSDGDNNSAIGDSTPDESTDFAVDDTGESDEGQEDVAEDTGADDGLTEGDVVEDSDLVDDSDVVSDPDTEEPDNTDEPDIIDEPDVADEPDVTDEPDEVPDSTIDGGCIRDGDCDYLDGPISCSRSQSRQTVGVCREGVCVEDVATEFCLVRGLNTCDEDGNIVSRSGTCVATDPENPDADAGCVTVTRSRSYGVPVCDDDPASFTPASTCDDSGLGAICTTPEEEECVADDPVCDGTVFTNYQAACSEVDGEEGCYSQVLRSVDCNDVVDPPTCSSRTNLATETCTCDTTDVCDCVTNTIDCTAPRCLSSNASQTCTGCSSDDDGAECKGCVNTLCRIGCNARTGLCERI